MTTRYSPGATGVTGVNGSAPLHVVVAPGVSVVAGQLTRNPL